LSKNNPNIICLVIDVTMNTIEDSTIITPFPFLFDTNVS